MDPRNIQEVDTIINIFQIFSFFIHGQMRISAINQ